MPTQAEIKAGLKMTMAVAEAIRELKQVPSGHLYAQMIGRVTFEGFEKMIAILVNAGLVAQDPSHLLRWVGPEVAN